MFQMISDREINVSNDLDREMASSKVVVLEEI
jgi:hypothetical protein